MKIQSKLNTKLLVNVFPWVSLILVVAVFGVASKGLLFSAYNLKTIFSQSVLFIIGGLDFLFCSHKVLLIFPSAVSFALRVSLRQRQWKSQGGSADFCDPVCCLYWNRHTERTALFKSWPRCLYPDPRCFLPVEGNLYDTARTNRSY